MRTYGTYAIIINPFWSYALAPVIPSNVSVVSLRVHPCFGLQTDTLSASLYLKLRRTANAAVCGRTSNDRVYICTKQKKCKGEYGKYAVNVCWDVRPWKGPFSCSEHNSLISLTSLASSLPPSLLAWPLSWLVSWQRASLPSLVLPSWQRASWRLVSSLSWQRVSWLLASSSRP